MFIALEVAVDAVRHVARVAKLVRVRDRNLADQLVRAAQSCAQNLGEGRRRAGGDRTYHFRCAAGSADEAIVALRIAEASELVTAAQCAEAFARLDRVLALTWPLTRR